MPKTILIVDDDSAVRLSADFLLSRHHYQLCEADSPESALAILHTQSIDLLLMDMNYTLDTTSGQEGLSLLQQVVESYPELPVVVMTAWSSVDLAVKAMKIGARDFVEKPWENPRLLTIIQQQLNYGELQQENRRLKQLQQESFTLSSPFIAESSAMKTLLEKMARVARTDATLLLTGENGTGKSCLAKFIHQNSLRQDQAFISLNMGAIPESLFESELFGHTRGAFTDAKSSRDGRFALAEKGTLFLDEIGTIPPSQQAKLLRILESGEYERVGESKTRIADVRIVSASNADFERLIEQKQFRQDLFYRLNTITLQVPALRDRREDIIPLANHFLQQFSQTYRLPLPTLSPCAQAKLLAHAWPGNIRELSHTLERVLLFCPAAVIDQDAIELPDNPSTKVSDSTQYTVPSPHIDDRIATHTTDHTETEVESLESAEIKHIRKALEHAEGNTADAARILDISLSALYRRMEKYDLKS